MYLSELTLNNFRNYSRLHLNLEPGPVLLQGKNAQGKTNLLEAIYFLSTTTSPHARSDRQLVNWLTQEQDVLPFTRLEGLIKRGGGTVQIAMTVVKEGERFKKDVRLNGVKKRAMDVIGKLNVVMFLPENIDLVTGSPGMRRRYLDSLLCQIDAEYCRALSQYNKLISQRNALLKELAEHRRSTDQLAYWDQQLTKHGALLIVRRHDAILELDAMARQYQRTVSQGSEGLRLYYAPSLDPHDRPKPDFQMPLITQDLGPSQIPAPPIKEVAAAFTARLEGMRREEIARGVTLIGPHRDDLRFLIDGIDVNLYGSRGQQRTTALSTKLAEVDLMKAKTGEAPVLLLDDVMSELDQERRSQVIRLIDKVEQAILTTTDWGDYDEAFQRQAQSFSVVGGQLNLAEPPPTA